MALVKKEKKTWFQRVRQLILGKEKPNMVTRISVGLGFLAWVYMISWYVLTLMSLLLMGSLKQSEEIEGAFQRVGAKLYRYSDTLNRLTIHTILELAAYTVILIGLILIYRRKRVGFLIYVIASTCTVLITLFVMQLKYFQYETTYMDIALTVITTAYFGIGAVWFYKIKPKQKPKNTLKEETA